MPIPAELGKYSNEDAFTKLFLIPLLQRLGFSVVMYHGTREFGKDLVFAEIDRFGHVTYHGLQAKHVETVGLGKASQDLIYDAQQAFANPFVHPQTGVEHRISGFYAVNGGSISEQAREHFFNSLQPQFGANVRLMDGTALVSLDKLAAFTRSNFAKERLSGLILEIRWNRNAGLRLVTALERLLEKGAYPMQRLRLTATGAMLEQPPMLSSQYSNHLESYWEIASMINRLIDSAGTPVGVGDFTTNRIRSSIELLPQMMQIGSELELMSANYLAQLGATVSGI